MLDISFDEYALRYMLLPGQQCNTQEIMRAVSLPDTLPSIIQNLFHTADQSHYQHIIINHENPILKQWNPYCGAAPLVSEHHLASQLNEDHRWMIQSFEKSSVALYHLIHESAHAVMAMVGQAGLLTLLSADQQKQFHAFSEACAILASDLVGHAALRTHTYFEQFWPSSIHRTHAVRMSPLEALQHSAINFECTPEASQVSKTSHHGLNVDQWLFDLYLSQQDSLPTLPTEEPYRAMALAFLQEESSYAHKVSSTVNPAWSKHYWTRLGIQQYLQDFMPAQPVHIPHRDIVIESIEDCRQHWYTLLFDFPVFNTDEAAYHSLRRFIQHKALICYQLVDTLQSHRLILASDKQRQALPLLQHYIIELKKHFDQSCRKAFDTLSPLLCDELTQQLTQQFIEVLNQLIQVCGSHFIMIHPYLEHISFTESLPVLKPHIQYESHELHGMLNFICQESKTFYKEHHASQSLNHMSHDMYSHYKWSHSTLGQLELTGMTDEIRAEIVKYFNRLYTQRDFYLCYPIHWALHAPFVDPLVGFRYQ